MTDTSLLAAFIEMIVAQHALAPYFAFLSKAYLGALNARIYAA